MKNFYLMLASLAFVGTSFAQNVPAKKYSTSNQLNSLLLKSKSEKSVSVGKKISKAFHLTSNNGPALKSTTVIDTLTSHFVGTPAVYTVTTGGFVAGHNSYGDLSKMQKFDAKYGVTSAGTISKVILAFGAKAGNAASVVSVKIWNDNAGEPGTVIGSTNITFADIDTTSANGLTVATFANPIQIPSNGVFYAGISFTYSGQDAVSLFTTSDGDFPDAVTHTWEEWSDNSMVSFGDPNNWDLDVALSIFPVVEVEAPIVETEIYSENFNNGIPSDYTILDLDGNTVASQIAALFPNAWVAGIATPGGDSSALSTSWYVSQATSNDWLITDTIIIPDTIAGAVLSWDGLALDPDFRDGYEVYISNTTKTVAGLQANPAVFTIAEENDEITKRKVNISSFIGDTIFIGFRNNSTDQFILSIDNIRVYVPNPYDFAVTKSDAVLEIGQYTQIPARQFATSPIPIKVSIANEGTTTPDTAEVFATITNGQSVIYSDTLIITTGLPTPSTEVEYTFNKTFTAPSAKGNYNLILNTTVKLSERENKLNNSNDLALGNYSINDTTFARDNGLYFAPFNFGDGSIGYAGNIYDLIETDTLTSVQVELLAGIPEGRNVSVSVFNVNNGVPSTTPAYTSGRFRTDLAGEYKLVVSGGLVLTPGSYLVTVNELDSPMYLGVATGVHTAATSLLLSPTLTQGAWFPIDVFGEFTFGVRAQFGNISFVGLNNEKALNAEVNVYPNPNAGQFNLAINSDVIESYTVEVSDMLGRVVKTYEKLPNGRFSIDMESESNGIYFVKVKSGDSVSTHKVMINR